MKLATRLLIFTALAAASIRSVHAAGVNLAWNSCLSEGGVANRDFACNTNTGSSVMVASFVLAEDQALCTGIEATVEVTAQTDSLPAWWRFYNAGSCRQTALSTSFDFSSEPGTSCTDMWSGQGTGGLGAFNTYWTTPQVPSNQANQARIRLAAAVPSTMPMQLTAATEYYAFKLFVSNAKSTGAVACGGCQIPVCILLTDINVVQSDGQHEQLYVASTSNRVTWQGATNCPAGMTQENITWGQIRSVMR